MTSDNLCSLSPRWRMLMLRPLSATMQWKTAIKRVVVCSGLVGFTFVALAGLGLFPRMQAAGNNIPERQLPAAPSKTKPQVVASYAKLPLSFEVNQGQTDDQVRFLARGTGYTIFLTGDEAVLSLRKPSARHEPDGQVPTSRSA